LDKKKTFYLNFDELVIGKLVSFDTMKDFVAFLEINYQIDFEKIDYFLFDEVKNVKNFNILLKALIDAYPNKKFICTSSGNYTWTNEIIEGLAGRNLQINVYGLDFWEFLEFKNVKFHTPDSEVIFRSLEKYFLEYISFWGYPKVVLSSYNEKKKILKSILDSVILKDIKAFLKQDQIIDFVKLIKYISHSTGSKFSYEALANELGLKVHTVKKYLFLLEQNFLVHFLPPFFTDKKNEISNKKKLYLLDFGIKNYYWEDLNLKTVYDGKDVEMFVFLGLLFNLEDASLYYYQTLNESEIDFIYQINGKLIPIEAKTSNNINVPKIFKSFCEKYHSQIDYFIKTSKFIYETRQVGNCKVYIKSFLDKLVG